VADGAYLWIFEELGGAKTLSSIDLGRVARSRQKSPPHAPAGFNTMALGGVPKLLSSIADEFRFGPPRQGALDELRVWTVAGRWSPARLAGWLPEQKEAIEAGREVDLSRLPPSVPDRIALTLGCDDLVPYRIEYWRSDAEPVEAGGKRGKAIAVIELYEVQLGPRIDAAHFAFHPDGTPAADRTKEFMDRLGLEDPPPEEANRRARPRR
jgi:hypothetical protein